MGSREWNAKVTCRLNDDCRGGLGSETVNRLQFDHLVTKRADDSPTARSGSRGHGRGAKDNNPFRNDEVISWGG